MSGAGRMGSDPNLGAMLDRACKAAGNAPAIESAGLSLDYRAFGDRAQALAERLRHAAITPNEPIPVMVSNHPLDLVAFAATWLAGGVVVPIHRGNPAAVVARSIDATGARLGIDALGTAHWPAGWARDDDTFAADRPAPAPRPVLADGAFVIFTSGSTGEPKGVVLSHRAFGGKLDAIDSLLGFRAGERTLLVLNLSFSFANWVGLLALKKGGTVVMHEKFAVEPFAQTLSRGAIDRVGVVPTMMRALFASDAAPAANGASLRQILIGGEPLGRALAAQLIGRFPHADLIDIYGLTETSTSDFFLFPRDHPRYSGCIGRASPGVRFRIAGPDGAEVPEGETGELQIRTPFAMNGYLDAPQATRAAFDDGWLRTGDIARLRDGDVVELAGRAKEIISRGGNKVSPLEIEQVFAEHPSVAAAMVTGVGDAIVGERIHLLIVARSGHAPTEQALREFAASRLAKFKLPDVVHFGSELPLGRTGKADRGVLRKSLESGQA